MAYGGFKDLNRKAAPDKVLRIKHFILLKIQNMVDINVDLLQWFIIFLIKKNKLLVVVLRMKIFIIKN